MHSITTSTRAALLLAAALVVSGCSGEQSKPAEFNQADYNKTLKMYMDASSKNFDGFSTDTPLTGTQTCEVSDSGKPTAQALCKVDEFDSQSDAKKSYGEQKTRLVAALPNAQGAEQANAAPNTPIRMVAFDGDKGVVLVMTKPNDKWLVGYVFQKKPKG